MARTAVSEIKPQGYMKDGVFVEYKRGDVLEYIIGKGDRVGRSYGTMLRNAGAANVRIIDMHHYGDERYIHWCNVTGIKEGIEPCALPAEKAKPPKPAAAPKAPKANATGRSASPKPVPSKPLLDQIPPQSPELRSAFNALAKNVATDYMVNKSPEYKSFRDNIESHKAASAFDKAASVLTFNDFSLSMPEVDVVPEKVEPVKPFVKPVLTELQEKILVELTDNNLSVNGLKSVLKLANKDLVTIALTGKKVDGVVSEVGLLEYGYVCRSQKTPNDPFIYSITDIGLAHHD